MCIIGIVGRPGELKTTKLNIGVLENYRKAIIKSGGVPILILPPQDIDYYDKSLEEIPSLTQEEKKILEKQIDLCDGILMPGGHVMHEYDKYICDYCNRNDIPLLGICMGMQVMCNYNNDNKNIKIENETHYEDALYKHDVNINKDSILYSILEEENIMVNSYHKYKVSNSGSYKISATKDDIIEAVEKDGKFNIGLQWHPEKNYDNDVNSKKIFKKFINVCKQK